MEKGLVNIQDQVTKAIGVIDASVTSDIVVFNERLSKQPPKAWVKEYNGAKYIPIRIIEQLMRSVFGGFQAEFVREPYILGNSVTTAIHLKYFHPYYQQWFTLPGVGSVPVQLNAKEIWGTDEKGKKAKVPNPDGARHAMDFERIKPMALHLNTPASLAFAMNNAAKKIGNIFGATLNANEDEVIPIIDVYDRKKADPDALLSEILTRLSEQEFKWKDDEQNQVNKIIDEKAHENYQKVLDLMDKRVVTRNRVE